MRADILGNYNRATGSLDNGRGPSMPRCPEVWPHTGRTVSLLRCTLPRAHVSSKTDEKAYFPSKLCVCEGILETIKLPGSTQVQCREHSYTTEHTATCLPPQNPAHPMQPRALGNIMKTLVKSERSLEFS